MAGKKGRVEGGKARAAQSKAAKFKYRSLTKAHRENVLRDKRTQYEAEHYSHEVENEVLIELNEVEEDETVREGRSEQIQQRKDRMAVVERTIDILNTKLLDVTEEEDEESEGNDG